MTQDATNRADSDALVAQERGAAAKAAYQAGRRTNGGADRRRLFDVGVVAARACLAAKADHPEGLLWLAANLGAGALARNKLAALRVVPEVERTLLRLEAVAPEHDHAAAARALGRLYHKAPAVISVGSTTKARLYFERALARAGGFRGNLALAAEFFADAGQAERARALARLFLDSAPPTLIDDPDEREWAQVVDRIVARSRSSHS